MKKLASGIIAGLLLLTSPATAECLMTGTIVQVRVLDEARKDVHTLYMRESQLDAHVYSFDTTNELIAATAMGLVAMQVKIEMVGDEFSCPSIGQDRFGGFLTSLTVNP